MYGTSKPLRFSTIYYRIIRLANNRVTPRVTRVTGGRVASATGGVRVDRTCLA